MNKILRCISIVAVSLFLSSTAYAARIQNPYNNLWYDVISGGDNTVLSWENAASIANSQNGHLATINNDNENDWLWNNFANELQQNFWIGLNDKQQEGTLAWESGDPVIWSKLHISSLTGKDMNTDAHDFVYLKKADKEWYFGGTTSGYNLRAIGEYANQVVPEPISSTLFLLGAGALALKTIRKRKKA